MEKIRTGKLLDQIIYPQAYAREPTERVRIPGHPHYISKFRSVRQGTTTTPVAQPEANPRQRKGDRGEEGERRG